MLLLACYKVLMFAGKLQYSLQLVPLHAPEGTTGEGQLCEGVVCLAAELNRTQIQPGQLPRPNL